MNPAERPLVSSKDIIILVALVILAPPARLFSVTLLQRLSRAVVPLLGQSMRAKSSTQAIASALQIPTEKAAMIADASLAARVTSLLLFLKGKLGGQSYRVAVSGQHHIDAAIDEGRGVVLWVAESTYCPDAVKIGLHECGYAVSHLSRPEHGFSSTRFGIAVLNPLRTAFELKFLRERIVFERNNREQAMQQISTRLNGAQIVSFLATGHEGKSLIEEKFLSGNLKIAGGAPSSAYRHGAVILPVFATPSPALPQMQIAVGEPLDLAGDDKAVAVVRATKQYLGQLELHVKAHPELWLQWKFVTA